MYDEEKQFANAINHVPEFGPKTLARIRNHFGSYKNAWEAEVREFLRIPQLEKKALFSLEKIKEEKDPEKEYKNLENEGISLILHDELPNMLKETPAPPEVLYVRGQMPKEDLNFLGVVGTRRYSTYGKEACSRIVGDLAGRNFVIVSGLAKGIDSFSHEAAIRHKIKTVAVLGSGISPKVLFPKENKKLADKIVADGGAIISEYPYEMKANINTFPQRNRIIAGLSRAVWIVEAREKSGALITARYALDFNREVLALPGSIFSENAKGTNKLIKEGAAAITSSIDILNVFGIESNDSIPKSYEEFSDIEKKILDGISEPILKDDLMRKLGLSPSEIIPTLSLLEIKGVIKDSGGEIFKVI
ncbi:DNA protecting protein DprA [Candidatus Giovannonibacteria bacterium RIFCSPLOWO2_02_FULL_43_11b]|uniref:DNA protecting protein DprA n=1 Tax=Candidatus Giovannonibacteria bacterium RIFCSPHIGHO2_12_FULL_43_15 TaxID=1798341 RepID=A0A1F5WQX8_9BACT|nr:MAG: DNA protecting protein DprA [Candidatus Giovannonibacteria bacterium RIFCSPHIGHO2_01_FULL_43_100]OGF66112.1 MAG: DNA protecting protein DprA [Candidatus Giovannonibacteria bacterium RIFCSPHIGHO2_02_FULL_43_32]OGF78068.1 MAG: DNA protecting protein DprA [Candidatus Giovannonibacteria bacterium RIFCSPHIGHO2_12_FULL_43_15]OGF78805.1 MAG: DNA protecting protein DprA [Candidatus Giovannonibacteria bacterium RIFCSPLOWO2_01_FULL_43_60]OGF89514.1 MAG: DNA protecting protein DprA [Candidatus Gio